MAFKGKSAGGFWNNVDGKLVSFIFSNIGPGTDAEAGDWLYLVPSFLADGAEDETTQHLFFGGVDRYSISKDGKTAQGITADGENSEVTSYGAKTPAGRFLDTLVEQGSELGIEALLPDLDAGEPINLEPIEGTRVRLVQEKDVAGTAKRGQREAKDGKKYDRTNSVVGAVYELPGAKKSATKGAKPAAGKAGKANTDVRDAADAIVLQLIADAQKADKKNKTGETPVSKFKMAALRAHAKDANKDAIIKMLGDEAYRVDAAEREVFAYDADGETVASV